MFTHSTSSRSAGLNGLFREDDYPSVENLRSKFGVGAGGAADPLRLRLSGRVVGRRAGASLREIDANVRESLTRGTEDLWKRLREVVSHMVERLNEPESRFHGSLVTNIADLVDILPKLNVSGDADLNRFTEQIKQRLCNYSAQELKKNELLRW